MSSICGIIAPSASVGCSEELINLSRRIKDKKIFENFNKNDVYIGLCSQKYKNDVESIIYRGVRYNYCFCGELYNSTLLAEKIKSELGYSPIESYNDGVIAAWCYILWGGFSPKMLKGKFSYAIYSEGIFKTSSHTPKVFIAKDRFGFIPIYYYQNSHGTVYFSSEISAMLEIKTNKREISYLGLWQMLYLDGMSLPDKTIFENIQQLKAGSCAYIDCRGKSNILIKCYDNPATYKPLSEQTLEGLIENSFNERGININERGVEFINSEYEIDSINTSVEMTAAPINPAVYTSISKLNPQITHISPLGKELISSQNFSFMKGFFSWISDPYKNMELIDTKKLRILDGFDYINSERLKIVDTESEKYELNSLYRFYIPMVLQDAEVIAKNLGIDIKYPYCDEDIVGYLYTKNQISDCVIPKSTKYKLKDNTKKSEFETHLIKSIENAISNSESVLNCIADREKLLLCISKGEFNPSLILLYSIHLMFERFNLNLNIKA